jgi:Uma2 family endonuclease
VRAPDVAFVRSSRVADGIPSGYFPGAPDFVVEVLSPNDRATDVAAKVADWLAAGAELVWVVDPAARTSGLMTGRGAKRSSKATPMYQAGRCYQA